MPRAKIAYEFCPFPRRWHAGWANHQTIFARGVRDALFELADGAAITIVGDDWLENLCKQMQVHGRERPNVRRTLKAFEADGLIAYDPSGRVLACFLHDADLRRTVVQSSSIGSPSVVDRSWTGRGSNIPIDSTPQNDSTRVLQTDREKEETERESARAHALEASSVQPRAELIGFRWFAALWGRSEFDVPPMQSFQRSHDWIGSRPAADRAKVGDAVQADEWCRTNKHHVTPDHIAKHWMRYLGGAAKPVLSRSAVPAREQLSEAREQCVDAAKAVRSLENAPWFDRQNDDGSEKPSWRRALDTATQRYRAAMESEQALKQQLRTAS